MSSRWFPWLPGLAALGWGLFLASRAGLALAVAGEPVSVWWLWPAWPRLAAWFLAGAGGAGAMAWLGARLLAARGGDRAAGARAWWPGVALLLPVALELAAPLYGHTLAPLALGRQLGWPWALGCAMATGLAWRAALPARAHDSASPAPRPWPRWPLWLVVAGALAAFLALGAAQQRAAATQGRFMGGDEPQYLFNTHSLAVDHDLDLADNVWLRDSSFFWPSEEIIGGHSHWSAGERLISKHRPGLPILLAPFYAWGLLTGVGVRSLCALAMMLAGVWLAAQVYLVTRDWTGRVGPALLASLGLCWSLPVLFYSNLVFPGLAATAVAFTAFRLVARPADGRWAPDFWAGACVAYLGWFHERFLLVSALLGLWFLLAGAWRSPRRLAAFLAPCLVSLGIMAAYFLEVHGTPLPSAGVHAQGGYLNPRGLIEGLLGILTGGGEGLFIHAPWYLLGLAGLIMALGARPLAAGTALAVVVGTYLTGGLYADWFGGGACPPDRYLLMATPFLALGLGVAWRRGGPLARVLTAPALLAALWVAARALAAPKSFYDPGLPLGQGTIWPLFEALCSGWLLPGHSPAQNLAAGWAWLGLAGVVGLAVLIWPRRWRGGGALAGALAGGWLLLVTAGVLAQAPGGGPSLAGYAQPAQALNAMAAAGRLGPRTLTWRAGPGAAGLDLALCLELTPARWAKPPAEAAPAGAARVPAGARGLVLWGQYFTLPPGDYRATASLEAPADSGRLGTWDAVARWGAQPLARGDLNGPGHHTLRFTLDQPAPGWELRFTAAGPAFGLNRLRLWWLSPAP